MHYAEYGALRTAAAAFNRLGIRRATPVARALADFGYSVLKIRRRVVEDQVAAAFPDLTMDRVASVARGAYENLARTTVETTILPSLPRDAVLDIVESVDGWEVVEQATVAGKGVIFVSGHIGNWELGAAYVAARGLDLDVIARHMANPLVDRYLTGTREKAGMHVVYDDQAVQRVPRTLRAGGAAAFLVDQATVGLASTWTPFFGRLAKTPRGPAVFALRLGAPVVFAVAVRKPSGRFHMAFEAIPVASTGDREFDVRSIVEAYTATLERWVRHVPEQYFWHHRRWKHQLHDAPADLTPIT